MSHGQNGAEGFSTIEILVAFVVLSLGLGLAVQTVAQAGWSLRRAAEDAREVSLVNTVMAEEVPRLLKTYQGQAIKAAGPTWAVELVPFFNGERDGPVRVIVRTAPGSNGSLDGIYQAILPKPAEGDEGRMP